VLLPNTVNAERFTPRPKPKRLLDLYGLRPEQPVILTVSRLVSSEQYKGYDKVIRALPEIQRAIPDVHYILVGKGDDRQRVEQLIDHVGVRAYTTLAGFVPDEELSDYYNLCDVFAMPSKREGFGIVFLEAMFFGLPCVGPNAWAVPEMILNGETGYTVPPDDTTALADRLVTLLTQPELAQRMGEAGRARAQSTFTWPAVVEKMLNSLQPLAISAATCR
jgi:glycosyltransferase involved in cell wall biosynthesis